RTGVRRRSSPSLAAASNAPPVAPPLRSIPDPDNPTPLPLPSASQCIALHVGVLLSRRSALLLRSPTLAEMQPGDLHFGIDTDLLPNGEFHGLPPSRPTGCEPDTTVGCSCLRPFPAFQRPQKPIRFFPRVDDVSLICQPVQHGLA